MVGPNKNIKQRDREEDRQYWQMIRKFIEVICTLQNVP
jgi:phosphate uptake regulator